MRWLDTYKLEQRAKKQSLIIEICKRYNSVSPSDEDLDEYVLELKKLSIPQLKKVLAAPVNVDGKTGFLGWFKSLSKRNRFLVTMFNRNGTVSHYVIDSKTRTFNVKSKTYGIQKELAKLNTTYNMVNFLYLEDIPLPLNFDVINEKILPIDAAAFKHIVKMEYAEMLANVSKVKDMIKLAALFAGVAALLGLVILLILVNEFNLI